ncbi:MAG: polymer-forming cytoskeletal protein [Nitrospirota bacterium]|jgi:cytoskeletal protein CcmA (bactofilin family)|nr:polymer-forming cytoskeletal protein [Nitrospirota bacterium]MDH4360338.1 polymer-forming cytoskeletal protein [Nitrospirota bacterium]MDH5296721.1 polymer-forming cytoskeletal protein [Nitrospirota bacterium]
MAPTSEVETMTIPQGQITSLGSTKSYQIPKPVVEGKSEVVAFFGRGVSCTGEIWYEGNVQIDGGLEGLVHTNGTLVIGDRAVIKATIEAGTVICKGSIQGDVVARETVKLLAPGSIDGTVSTPRLSVETGGVINGRVSMDLSQ